MRRGDSIMTAFGRGVIKSREADTGILSKRFLVTLDEPEKLGSFQRQVHKKYGGLYILKKDLTEV